MKAIFTVKMLIDSLQKFDLELPVCIADWNEGYRFPSSITVTQMSVQEGDYDDLETNRVTGQFLCLGGE